MESLIIGILGVVLMFLLIKLVRVLADIVLALVGLAVLAVPATIPGPIENSIAATLLASFIGAIVALPILPYTSYFKDEIIEQINNDSNKDKEDE